MNEDRPRPISTSSARRPAPPDLAPDDDGCLATLIPYRNTPALIGYYLAVFGLVPFLGLPLALAAIPLGIAGIRRYRRDPRVKGLVHAWFALLVGLLASALWLGLITLIVVAINRSQGG